MGKAVKVKWNIGETRKGAVQALLFCKSVCYNTFYM